MWFMFFFAFFGFICIVNIDIHESEREKKNLQKRKFFHCVSYQKQLLILFVLFFFAQKNLIRNFLFLLKNKINYLIILYIYIHKRIDWFFFLNTLF